ncbi:AAEL006631-PA [Aedes aegypti]|uniref:AAEL006631-PA n=1 Tax=Aedes aegypti TaxID=7159 RepID=Q175L2_AEDAE|nr:AAEL006631-PA [Aedes aegypti]
MKHIVIRYNFIREKTQEGVSKIIYEPTSEQVAHIFIKTDPNCSSDSEHKVEKDENLHLADADEPTVPNPDDFTSDAESSDVRKDYSDRDMNQTSSSESDRVKSPELRTKRKSRRKPDSTEPKTASPKEPLPKKYKCDDCGKSFAHQPWWAAHRAKAHGIQETVKPNKQNRIHCCDECPKSFCDWRNLVYHLRHIHQKKIDAVQIVSCQLCKRKLLSENELKLHTCSTRRGFQSRPPEFKCDQCGKAYVSRQALESHRSVHEETHTISCDLCEKPFANEKDLSYHKKRVHVDASFVCEVCGKAFKVQNQLKTHTNIHMKSKSYQCEYCGRAFAQRNGMTAHLRIAHAEQLGEQALAEREISCPICFKKLKGKVCYRLHMKTHTNDRMYACSFCEKRFVTNQDKLRHEQTHTKKYKFKCRFCDKGSTRRKLILLHEAKEHNEVSGEAIGPQHKCSICGRCFSSPSAVAIHESLHSDALPVGCELCDRRFKNVKYMKYHLKAHHKLEAAEQKENGAMVSVDDENEAGQQVSKTEKGDVSRFNIAFFGSETFRNGSLTGITHRNTIIGVRSGIVGENIRHPKSEVKTTETTFFRAPKMTEPTPELMEALSGMIAQALKASLGSVVQQQVAALNANGDPAAPAALAPKVPSFSMSEYRSTEESSVSDYFNRFEWAAQLSHIPADQYANYARVHMGAELNNALKFLVSPNDPAATTYQDLRTTLIDHFDRAKNKFVESIKFRHIVQEKDESVAKRQSTQSPVHRRSEPLLQLMNNFRHAMPVLWGNEKSLPLYCAEQPDYVVRL